jgi:hypothetical protein
MQRGHISSQISISKQSMLEICKKEHKRITVCSNGLYYYNRLFLCKCHERKSKWLEHNWNLKKNKYYFNLKYKILIEVVKYNISNGGSMENLKYHLKSHWDNKFDPSMVKQAKFMKNFLQEGKPTIVVAILTLLYWKMQIWIVT